MSHGKGHPPPAPPVRHISLAQQAKDADQQVHEAQIGALKAETDRCRRRVLSVESNLRWWAACTGEWRSKFEASEKAKTLAVAEARQFQDQVTSISSELENLRAENARLREELTQSTALREELVFGAEKVRAAGAETDDVSSSASPSLHGGRNAQRDRLSDLRRTSQERAFASNEQEGLRHEVKVLNLKLDEARKLLAEERR